MNSEESSAAIVWEKPQRSASPSSDLLEPPAKRSRLDTSVNKATHTPLRQNGIASIKSEYLIDTNASKRTSNGIKASCVANSRDEQPLEPQRAEDGRGKRQKSKGQNVNRSFGSSRDAIQLCMSRARSAEFSPEPCQFGDKCKYEHDLRRYLKEGKREDLSTFDGKCPVWEARGSCSAGWRCRFARSHSMERTREDGRQELVLLDDPQSQDSHNNEEGTPGIVNVVSAQDKIALQKKKISTPKADAFMKWLNQADPKNQRDEETNANEEKDENATVILHDDRATFVEPPLLASEKRRLHYGPETPVLAPLTTQGNLPFRRLCVELGAQVTWSEMAMSLPLLQGVKTDWTLMRAHETELVPPKCSSPIVDGYDNATDLKFGAQIAANKPWLATKITEVLTSLCPHLRAVDLNCGCPIDMVFRQGSGSALLDSPAKLEKILRGMNAVSNQVPITLKIRMGTRDDKPTAERLIDRLAFGGSDYNNIETGSAGVAAITLHGRSRQQRYTRSADWEYISSCAALINGYKEGRKTRQDTEAAVDPRYLPAQKDGKIFFIGNGDCYSHVDYFKHIEETQVDSVMIARGALIKPWIFEEIEKGQYLDKPAKERLTYIEKFVKYGLASWGSDEIGVGTTRRFLLEWLSFSCRYVPIGLLEHLPPRIQDRPPAYRGRDELETLLSSDNYRDWIKISEMFLGPAHKDFKFEPKHKSHMHADSAEG